MSASVSVCLSANISPEPHTRSLTISVRVAYRRDSVLFRRTDAIPKGRGNFRGFLPVHNALYSTAFGTHTKTAKPIQMPFGLMTRVGLR